jgi:hypothetical protein
MKAPRSVHGRIIIDRSQTPWQSQQVQEPCILPNPKDPSRLVMLYSAIPKSDRNTCAIGKAWATVDDPLTWHQDAANPVFVPNGQGWDARYMRLDAVLYIPEDDAYYIYYTGTVDQQTNQIGLAICPAGPDGYSSLTPQNIQRWSAAPVLAPEPAAPYRETYASQAAVCRERNATGGWDWHMYYSYRDAERTLAGLRYATSTDGKTWTRHWDATDPRGLGHIFASMLNAYYEWHQVTQVGRTYVLSMEVGPEFGRQWRTVLAISQHPARGWTQLDPNLLLQSQWPGIYSEQTIYHVATPAFYTINGRGYLFTQACARPGNDNYIDGNWELWGFTCEQPLTLPGGDVLLVP